MHPLKIALQRRGVQARKKLMALLYYLRAQDLKRGRGGKPPPHEVLEPPSNHTEVPEGTSDIYDAITTGYSDDPWFQDEKHIHCKLYFARWFLVHKSRATYCA
jgi:hypothetical protein